MPLQLLIKIHLAAGGTFAVAFTGSVVSLDCVLPAQGNRTGLSILDGNRQPPHLSPTSSLPGVIDIIYVWVSGVQDGSDGNSGVSCWHCPLRAECKIKCWRRKKKCVWIGNFLGDGGRWCHSEWGLWAARITIFWVLSEETTNLLL